jgi:hypothetical protein
MGCRMRSLIMGFAVVTLTAIVQVPAANAAFDQTPPSLTVNVTPAFVVGNIVTDGEIDTVHYTRDIAQLIQWSATDNVGVCSYDLFAVPAGAPPEMLLEFSQDTQYTYNPGSDYNGDFGGGSNVIDSFVVTARDCTGNATIKAVDEHIFVFQEDGMSPTDGPQSLTYTGTWGQGNCSCFLAGHTAFATKSGARATFTRTFTGSDQIALVMAEGPGRGAASIRIDGKWLMNIDTFAAVNTNRVVVFEGAMPAGIHTLTIVNHGTTGRPRIDLDAILVGHSPAG